MSSQLNADWPKVVFRRRGNEWECSIENAVGHHGIAETQPLALLRAAAAWAAYEEDKSTEAR